MSPTRRYSRHDESLGRITLGADALFAILDDHARLSSHMSKPSWRMAWSTMTIIMDERAGSAIGALISLRARVLGIRLWVNEVVTVRTPPLRKEWETVAPVRLLVIGDYRMGFAIERDGAHSTVRVFIDYNLPDGLLGGVIGRIFATAYARWCTRQIVADASKLGTPQ
jgi:hypothetical protein